MESGLVTTTGGREDAVLASVAFALLTLLLTHPASAQGSVTPSFGTGKLILVGEGYRSGEPVEITVRSAGINYPFTATADPRGRFRLDTGLMLPPLSGLQIEARDEEGQTQATMTSAPGGLPGAPAGRDGSPGVNREAEPEGTDCPE
jgi:hypothetical protein